MRGEGGRDIGDIDRCGCGGGCCRWKWPYVTAGGVAKPESFAAGRAQLVRSWVVCVVVVAGIGVSIVAGEGGVSGASGSFDAVMVGGRDTGVLGDAVGVHIVVQYFSVVERGGGVVGGSFLNRLRHLWCSLALSCCWCCC